MTYVQKYDVYAYESDTYTRKEYSRLKQQRFLAMRAADKKANQEEAALRARGICPKCHMILPTSGKCDCCE